jgi:hypothetical protein
MPRGDRYDAAGFIVGVVLFGGLLATESRHLGLILAWAGIALGVMNIFSYLSRRIARGRRTDHL